MGIDVANKVIARNTIEKMHSIVLKAEADTIGVALVRASLIVEAAAKDELSKTSHQSIKHTGFDGRTKHSRVRLTRKGNASAADRQHAADGEPPMLLTGNLRRSVKSGKPEFLGYEHYYVQVGPTAVYGRIQELPRSNGGYNHPYMKPALDKVRGRIKKIYEDVWKESLR